MTEQADAANTGTESQPARPPSMKAKVKMASRTLPNITPGPSSLPQCSVALLHHPHTGHHREAAVAAIVRETVSAVERLLKDSDGESVTVTNVATELKLDRGTALRRVRAAIERGYLKNLEDRKGRPARLVMGDPLPEDVEEVLPSVERLQGCTVARETKGIGTPPPRIATSERERFTV